MYTETGGAVMRVLYGTGNVYYEMISTYGYLAPDTPPSGNSGLRRYHRQWVLSISI